MKNEISKEKHSETFNIADVIGWVLFSSGIFNFISYLMLVFSQDTTDKWFTRQCLSLICFGFAGVIFRLRK